MILRNFREEYSKAMKSLPEFHIDVGAVRDEAHHRKMVSVRRRKAIASVASAACILLLCGVGTATAVSFQDSRVEIGNHGFAFLRDDTNDEPECCEEEAGDTVMTFMLKGASSDEKGAAQIEAASGSGAVLANAEVEVVDAQERIYDTIADFRRSEDIVMAIPRIAWLGDLEELEEQLVIVSDVVPRVRVIVEFEGKSFTMVQADNRGYSAYASSTTYMGEVANKRTLINEQGLVYQVFDSAEEGEIISTHAAISVNGRDLTFSFSGYKKDEVDAVLKQLDVNVYFVEE